MKTLGASFLKRLYVLLAVLLCSMPLMAMPVVSHTGPTYPVAQSYGVDTDDDAPCTLAAGEVTSGEAEAVLQLDKSLLAPLVQYVLQQKYPESFNSPVVPAYYAFSKRNCGLHTILTKGP